jgi:hypothetical protein
LSPSQYSYCDPMAGEIGVVYQACGWIHLGQGPGRTSKGRWRFFSGREGKWLSERTLRKRRLKLAELRSHPGWIAEWTPDKGALCPFRRLAAREARSSTSVEVCAAGLSEAAAPEPRPSPIAAADGSLKLKVFRPSRAAGPGADPCRHASHGATLEDDER